MNHPDLKSYINREVSGIPRLLGKIVRAAPAVFLVSALIFLLIFNSSASAATFGDVNGDSRVNVRDVVLVMRHILALDSLSENKRFVADVNGDGIVNVQDVSLIMRKSLGMIDAFHDAPKSKPHLVVDFIVGDEPVTPGKRLVIVTLNVDDPDHYRVTVAGAFLDYSDAIECYLGEVSEEDALREKTAVYRLKK